jgi:hypothetical protein
VEDHRLILTSAPLTCCDRMNSCPSAGESDQPRGVASHRTIGFAYNYKFHLTCSLTLLQLFCGGALVRCMGAGWLRFYMQDLNLGTGFILGFPPGTVCGVPGCFSSKARFATSVLA